MKSVALFFISGIAIGSYIYPVHPVMTLVSAGCVIIAASCLVHSEKIRIWLLLSLFTILGSILSCYQMQRLSDRYKTENRSTLFYLYHEESRQERATLSGFRERLSSMYDDFRMSDDNRSIVKAMTLGDKSGISKDVRMVYSRTGAAHVLALSGMHLAVISAILSFFFLKIFVLLYYSVDWLWKKRAPNPRIKAIMKHRMSEPALRHIATGCIIIIIWLYVLMVGMPSSVVRAATMLTLYGISRFLFRQGKSVNILSISAFVMLLASPLSLFDVGFQMSFVAVLGISIYFKPMQEVERKVMARLSNNKDWWDRSIYISVPLKLIELTIDCILLSISAQLLVAPLVAFYFGIISLSSLLTTAVVSLTATLIVTISFLCLSIGLMFSMSAAVFVSPLLDYVVTFQQSILRWQSTLPYSYADGVELSFPQLCLLYVIIYCITSAISKLLNKNGSFR